MFLIDNGCEDLFEDLKRYIALSRYEILDSTHELLVREYFVGLSVEERSKVFEGVTTLSFYLKLFFEAHKEKSNNFYEEFRLEVLKEYF